MSTPIKCSVCVFNEVVVTVVRDQVALEELDLVKEDHLLIMEDRGRQTEVFLQREMVRARVSR